MKTALLARISWRLLLLVFFLLSAACSYAPEGSSRTPYTPVFRAFLGDGVALNSLIYRCDINDDRFGLSTGLGGRNLIPTISWIDAPVSSERDVQSYYVGIFSNATGTPCTIVGGNRFPCTHVILSVDVATANYGGLTDNSGEINNTERGSYRFSDNSWSSVLRSRFGDREYVGACRANQTLTYRIVVIAASTGVGEISGSGGQYVTYEDFINRQTTGAIGPAIIDLVEFDTTYTIQ